MKVKDLIKQLNNVDPELECYVYADHGQEATGCNGLSVEKILLSDHQENYYVDLVHPDDLELDEEYIDICVISD